MSTNARHLSFYRSLLELQTANSAYEEKLKSGHNGEQTMFSLSWDIEELKKISTESRKLYHEISECINVCTPEMYLSCNIP